MDIVEQRIREVFAIVLSRSAKALERTASELEQVASQLRRVTERPPPDDPWADDRRREPDAMIRSAPLRAVPNTSTDDPLVESLDTQFTPSTEPPELPQRERPGDVDAVASPSLTVAGPPDAISPAGGLERADSERMRALADGTVNQVRARLGELSVDDLRALREAELAGRNRTTLIAVIDRALILHD